MRILITGMMKVQARALRPGFFGSGIVALHEALLKAKHTVEWRQIAYAEKGLQKYDLLILGLGALGDFSNQFLYQVIHASQYDNVLFLIDDWRANGALRGLRDNDIFREFLFKNGTGKHVAPETVKKDRKLLEKLREKMFRKKTNLLGSFFEFGDRDIILEDTPFTEVKGYDPSSFLYNFRLKKEKLVQPARRIERWVYGSLGDHKRWHNKLDAQWPIVCHMRKHGNFLTEPELLKEYIKSTGMLAPMYQASGSGWWRPRYIHAAYTRTPMFGDESEAGGFHRNYWKPIDEIEAMSRNERKSFADDQHEMVMDAIPSWNHLVDSIDEIVREAAE